MPAVLRGDVTVTVQGHLGRTHLADVRVPAGTSIAECYQRIALAIGAPLADLVITDVTDPGFIWQWSSDDAEVVSTDRTVHARAASRGG